MRSVPVQGSARLSAEPPRTRKQLGEGAQRSERIRKTLENAHMSKRPDSGVLLRRPRAR